MKSARRYPKARRRVLELLARESCSSADLFSSILAAGYGASPGKIAYTSRQLGKQRMQQSIERLERRIEYQRYRVLLSALRKDGLIEKDSTLSGAILKITKKGRAILRDILRKRQEPLPSPRYEKQDSPFYAVVSFDIPENLRAKRDWLRLALHNLGMECIHQSLWLGKIKLSKKFLQDLRSMRIGEYVEIFQMSKMGSLEEMIKSES